MSKRVSHSLLDPLFMPLVPRLYALAPIPRRFPPEGIIAVGHLLAIAGAVGFAYTGGALGAPGAWWGGLLAAVGVAGNHVADMLDGTHARRTGQCRNGGELLDHFTDPLSFSYWMIGLGVAAGRLDLALANVLWIYASAVLTNIRAKLTGVFVLARVGPTEFKTLLTLLGVALMAAHLAARKTAAAEAVTIALWIFAVLGAGQLMLNLVRGVRAANRQGAPPDDSEWRLSGQSAGDGPAL